MEQRRAIVLPQQPTGAAVAKYKLPHCSAIRSAVEYLHKEQWNILCDVHEFD